MQQFLDEIEAGVPALRRYARALVRDPDRADDLVQDTIERAIRKRRLWRPTGTLRAWLFRILVNVHRNELRRERRQGGVAAPLDGLAVEPSVPAPQPGRIALAETARALDGLPNEQREALLLVVIDGASYRDAAHILGIPTGTLMSRLSRARATLKSLTSAADEPRLRTVK